MVAIREPFCFDTSARQGQPPIAAYMVAGEAAAQGALQAPNEYRSPPTLGHSAQMAPAATMPPLPPSARAALSPGLAWPPGYAGVLAHYIFDSAPRPVAEVAIVGALGLLAGICGKSWTSHKGFGTNLYIILVARSAIGKEAMHTGVGRLIDAAANHDLIRAGRRFVSFDDFASGPALQKACAVNNSFVNVAGEIGQRLKHMVSPSHRDPNAQSLRRVMTNLYMKSGPGSYAGGIAYSDSKNNAASVEGVAYSLIGETTPNTFYELITPEILADGFVSRFSVVEYEGERPPDNKLASQFETPQPSTVEGLQRLIWTALDLQAKRQTVRASATESAAELFDDFDAECDCYIAEAGGDESRRQMWNRAFLKAVRIATLIAVADAVDKTQVAVNEVHAHWAIQFVRKDVAAFERRLSSGDVGLGDDARERKVSALVIEYLGTPAGQLPKSFAEFEKMRSCGIVPRKFLQIRTQKVASFSQHRFGATRALDDVLRSMVKNGQLQAVPSVRLSEDFVFGGEAFYCRGPFVDSAAQDERGM